MHEEEETYNSVGASVEEQPSSSPVFEEVITPVGVTLVSIQDVPKKNQGMQMFQLSAHHMEDCGDMPLHDLGSRYTADLE